MELGDSDSSLTLIVSSLLGRELWDPSAPTLQLLALLEREQLELWPSGHKALLSSVFLMASCTPSSKAIFSTAPVWWCLTQAPEGLLFWPVELLPCQLFNAELWLRRTGGTVLAASRILREFGLRHPCSPFFSSALIAGQVV